MTTNKSQALERPPQALGGLQVAAELGIVRQSADGTQVLIDFTDPGLREKYNVLAQAAVMARVHPWYTPAPGALYCPVGECYPIEFEGSGNNRRPVAYGLPKQHIDKLAALAGISVCGREEELKNGRLTITIWACRRKLDGEWETMPGSRVWLMADEEEIMRSKVPDWVLKDGPADASNPTFNRWWSKEWLQGVKRHSTGNTETKARLRAFRALLGVKGKYTAEELAKPFLVCPILKSPDMSIPGMREAVIAQGAQAADSMFGPGQATYLPPAARRQYQQLEPVNVIYDDALEDALAADPKQLPAGDVIDGDLIEDPPTHDPETGEILPAQVVTHGPRPEDDKRIPKGPHEGQMLSELARIHPDYVRAKFSHSANAALGSLAEAWLVYWHGEDDFDDIRF